MSEKRETILRLVQDKAGRILDVKVEQQPVPEPKYVFDASNYYTRGGHSDGDTKLLVSGSIKSYKTVGNDKTVIPVPCSVNGEPVTIGASGEGSFNVLFDTATMEPDPEHPTVYDVVARFVQEESGETFTRPYTIKTSPYLRTSGHSARVSYRGEEQTLDVVLKNALYKDLVVGETPEWLHASMVGKQLRVTCDKNFKVKERSGVVTLSLSSDDKTNASVTITQDGAELRVGVRISDVTDEGLSDDKTRRLVRLRLTIQIADQHTGEIIDPDVPWTVTGSDERVVVESVDEAKRELLLSTDSADTLETPVTVTLHLEDGSDITMEYPLFKADLTPSGK